MKTYEIETADGNVYEVDVDDGREQMPSAKESSTPYQDIWSQKDKSIASKAWDSLAVPAQTASKVLNLAASKVPEGQITGDLPTDLILGTPKIVANTVAEAAPKFVDRASIVTAGLAKLAKAAVPLKNAIGEGLAAQLESATGSNPGSLKRAWNDPTLMFAEGKKAASPIYEMGKNGSKIAKDLSNIPTKDKFLEVASDFADRKILPPETALEARKIASKMLRKGGGKFTEDYLRGLIDKFDDIAKSNEKIAQGDAAFRRGIDAESLRKLLPQNKHGGTSAFKMAIMNVLGPSFAGVLSPAVHGAVATAGGVLDNALTPIATNPQSAIVVKNLIEQLKKKYDERRDF